MGPRAPAIGGGPGRLKDSKEFVEGTHWLLSGVSEDTTCRGGRGRAWGVAGEGQLGLPVKGFGCDSLRASGPGPLLWVIQLTRKECVRQAVGPWASHCLSVPQFPHL